MPESVLSTFSTICKVDRELGIVIGYGIVCKERDASGVLRPYFDHDRDGPENITERGMVGAAADFAQSERVMGFMHEDEPAAVAKREINRGTVVWMMPMTESIAKSLGMTIQRSGLIIGVKPSDPSILAKFESGELKGFSIRGARVEGDEQPLEADPNSDDWQRVRYVAAGAA